MKKRGRPPVPWSEEKEQLLHDLYYNKGFALGRDRLYSYVKQLPNIKITRRQVLNWLKKQKDHQLSRSRKTALTQRTAVFRKPNNRAYIDHVELPITRQGHRYLLTYMDAFSKKAYAMPVKRKDQPTTTQALGDIIDQNGGVKPKTILSDNDRTLINAIKNYGIKSIRTPVHNPQANSVERWHSTLLNTLRRLYRTRGPNWHEYIQDLLNAYNNAWHRSLPMNITPNIAHAETDPYKLLKISSYQLYHRKKPPVNLKGKPLEKGNYVRLAIDPDNVLGRKKTESVWSPNRYRISRIYRRQVVASKPTYAVQPIPGESSAQDPPYKWKKRWPQYQLLRVPKEIDTGPDTYHTQVNEEEQRIVQRILRRATVKGVPGFDVVFRDQITGKIDDHAVFVTRETMLQDAPKLVKQYEKRHPKQKTPTQARSRQYRYEKNDLTKPRQSFRRRPRGSGITLLGPAKLIKLS